MYDNTTGAENTAIEDKRVWTLLWEQRRSNKRPIPSQNVPNTVIEMERS